MNHERSLSGAAHFRLVPLQLATGNGEITCSGRFLYRGQSIHTTSVLHSAGKRIGLSLNTICPEIAEFWVLASLTRAQSFQIVQRPYIHKRSGPDWAFAADINCSMWRANIGRSFLVLSSLIRTGGRLVPPVEFGDR